MTRTTRESFRYKLMRALKKKSHRKKAPGRRRHFRYFRILFPSNPQSADSAAERHFRFLSRQRAGLLFVLASEERVSCWLSAASAASWVAVAVGVGAAAAAAAAGTTDDSSGIPVPCVVEVFGL